jgi:hypothetical protein
MQIVLALAFVMVIISFWHAHRRHDVSFNALDLVMVNGQVDKIALAFMVVLGVTTWIVIDLQLKGKLTEGYFTTYGGMWVIPLVAKVVFNKAEIPTSTSVTSMTSTTVTQDPVKE